MSHFATVLVVPSIPCSAYMEMTLNIFARSLKCSTKVFSMAIKNNNKKPKKLRNKKHWTSSTIL